MLTLFIGWTIAYYYKVYVYHVPDVANALTLLITVVVRSTFFSVLLGLGYTQILELMLAGIFYGASWTKWLFTRLHFSASFLLNLIGNRVPKLPEHIPAPVPAIVVAGVYALLFIPLAVRIAVNNSRDGHLSILT